MNFKAIFESNKQRVSTGIVMIAGVVGIAILDNSFVTWALLGVAYLFAFS